MLTNFANAFNRLAKFSATEIKPISIQGANYDAISTGDGYFTIKDVMMFGEVPAGEKNAPKDIKAAEMQQMVDSATRKYQNEKFAAPAHLGHHKSIALKDPEFLGFMLPKRVGRTTLDGKEQDAVFGDVKVKASAFERIQKGELPYVSPEVDWATMQFSSLAFLDSMPPHFKGPLITVGAVKEDSSAKFTVGATLSMGQFMALDSDQQDASADDKSAQMCSKCKGPMTSDFSHIVKPDSMAPKEDDMDKKDEKKEVAPKFSDDPELLAKFAAQEAKLKAFEDKLAAKDAEADKKARIEAAFAEMKGRPLTDAGKAGIAKFADDPEKLKVFVEVLKAQTPENPPKSVAAFEAMTGHKVVDISGAHADFAAFQAKGPETMEAAMKWAGYFETWKSTKLAKGSYRRENGMNIPWDRKSWVELQMEIDPTAKTVPTNINLDGVR
jgi:hypothetical protein